MRYFITQGQLHSIIYNYLDDKFSESDGKKIVNVHNPDAYRIELFANTGSEKIVYYFFGTGEYDDWGPGGEGTKHYGHGMLQVHPNIIDTMRQMILIRETKVIDIVADWVSEKFGVDIDEVSIYPKRDKPTVY